MLNETKAIAVSLENVKITNETKIYNMAQSHQDITGS